MNPSQFLAEFGTIAAAPNGVQRLREMILQLAVMGKLVPQDPADEPASVLLQRIAAEKDRLIRDGTIKRPKPLPAIRDDEKPFELPHGWEWVRFGAATINRDAERIPLSTDIRMGMQGNYDYYGASGIIDKVNDFLFDKSLLLIGEDGANLINRSTPIAFIATGKYWVNNHAHVIDGISVDFLKYIEIYINSISLEPYVTGTAQPKMNQAKLNSIILSLPPAKEQKRIVAKVDSLMALCDKLETLQQQRQQLDPMTQTAVLEALTQEKPLPNPPLIREGSKKDDAPSCSSPDKGRLGGVSSAWQRLNQHMTTLFHTPESVKALRETILQLAVMGKLVPQDTNDEPAAVLLQHIATEKDRLIQEGKIKRQKPLPAIRDDEKPFELPSGWEWVRLDALITLISGQHLNPEDYSEKEIENGIPYISGPADFGVKHPDPVRFTKERRSVANADDILLTVKGSGVGKLNIASQQELAIGRQIMAIRSIKTSWHYVYLWMKNQEKAFQQSKTGIAIPGIGRDDVLGAIFCLPPLAEQQRIVAKVDSLMALCDKLETRLQAARETAGLFAVEAVAVV